MYFLGRRSKKCLTECHEVFILIFEDLIQYTDFALIEGHRGEEAQELAFRKGLSHLHFPKSEHNKKPSLAIHAAPYPIDWNDRERFTFLAGQIIVTGRKYNAIIRWGGDWDSDGELRNNNFDDLAHYEFIGWIKEVSDV